MYRLRSRQAVTSFILRHFHGLTSRVQVITRRAVVSLVQTTNIRFRRTDTDFNGRVHNNSVVNSVHFAVRTLRTKTLRTQRRRLTIANYNSHLLRIQLPFIKVAKKGTRAIKGQGQGLVANVNGRALIGFNATQGRQAVNVPQVRNRRIQRHVTTPYTKAGHLMCHRVRTRARDNHNRALVRRQAD